MRSLLLALLCTLPAAALRAAPDDGKAQAAVLPKHLLEGSYRARLEGILCDACKRGILREVRQIPGMGEAVFEEEAPILRFTVKRGGKLLTHRLERALRRAAELVDLDTHYTIVSLQEE